MNRKHPLVEGEIYHIYNRGVDKRDIFLEDQEYSRFLRAIAEFNSTLSAESRYYKTKHLVNLQEIGSPADSIPLVEILAFTLLSNHYHFLLRQIAPNGISEFMKKLGIGYTLYFNTKHKRSGSLFQGKFKSVHVAREAYAMYIPHYIHLNVLDVLSPGWKDASVAFSEELFEKMKNYPWSSLGYYLGGKRYKQILATDTINELLPGGVGKAYENSLKESLVGEARPLVLEQFLRDPIS